jgi:hypothetical protein
MSSLPVPVSPVMSTLMSVAATFCSLRKTSIMRGAGADDLAEALVLSSASSLALSARSAFSSIAFWRMSDACEAKIASSSSWVRSKRLFTLSLPT